MSDTDELRLPVVEEQVSVERRRVETDHVRVRTVVDTREELVSETVEVGSLDIERRPVDRAVATPPPPREEGDATIISVVEERLVVTRQLFVIEEVVVRRVIARETVSMPVTLRTMRAVVERDPVHQQEDH
ncbi:DUF2382 domain-containing protein [Sphingomonas bacterium]|uniref:DUF2382 domain-containing protein n=1 Tax=Sphingomonas bacterium TaxID=1895847 RepID=UPI00157560DF|nr:DUF2382 domain-containing protein [Sphingomonas bacterium]